MSHGASATGLARRALIVANHRASRVENALEEALHVLRAHRFDCIRATPSNPERLLEMLREGRASQDVVVLAGGDGTLNRALPALRGAGAPLGILPMGTANDLARTLGLPLEPAEAARVIATGEVSWIDVGRVNDHYFFNAAHIGFSASARDEVTADRKRRWGSLAYPLALVKALRSYHPFLVRIQVEGRHRRLLAMQVTVGNGRYYGGGLPVVQNAGIHDARLDVYCIRAGGAAALVRALRALWRGEAGPQSIWRAQGRHVELYTHRPHRIIADGERTGYTPAVFDVEAGAVPVIIPGHRRDGDRDVSG